MTLQLTLELAFLGLATWVVLLFCGANLVQRARWKRDLAAWKRDKNVTRIGPQRGARELEDTV